MFSLDLRLRRQRRFRRCLRRQGYGLAGWVWVRLDNRVYRRIPYLSVLSVYPSISILSGSSSPPPAPLPALAGRATEWQPGFGYVGSFGLGLNDTDHLLLVLHGTTPDVSLYRRRPGSSFGCILCSCDQPVLRRRVKGALQLLINRYD